jgi:hypothetical protein
MNRHFVYPDGRILRITNLPLINDSTTQSYHDKVNAATIDVGCKEIGWWEYYKRSLGMSLNALLRNSRTNKQG